MNRTGIIAIGVGIAVGVAGHIEYNGLRSDVTRLQHACVPMYTGGGVTQCAQPSIVETETTASDIRNLYRTTAAIQRCVSNADGSWEDQRRAFIKCTSDYEELLAQKRLPYRTTKR